MNPSRCQLCGTCGMQESSTLCVKEAILVSKLDWKLGSRSSDFSGREQ